ncbi:hypothetical protein BU26DRAFT_329069 [Trematosphaeria pertusa]|uniref:Uncharacterized protein n=1 Tax=Trematosphaeria pertusa TaxID=390896 RepID=A0A6A6IF88_9PLEO|nr:uncharacterized protein BU26DRAFT_329069 [Trematosphaeria pertusa]KAF2248200.1 hypothetical protein BU26DRAFT_329069 [Trematosphaeria pertusa]
MVVQALHEAALRTGHMRCLLCCLGGAPFCEPQLSLTPNLPSAILNVTPPLRARAPRFEPSHAQSARQYTRRHPCEPCAELTHPATGRAAASARSHHRRPSLHSSFPHFRPPERAIPPSNPCKLQDDKRRRASSFTCPGTGPVVQAASKSPRRAFGQMPRTGNSPTCYLRFDLRPVRGLNLERGCCLRICGSNHEQRRHSLEICRRVAHPGEDG